MATSNSTLSLYQQCPPGLGDAGCLEATCGSPFVDPAMRPLKPADATACATCDEGFSGLNCNMCQGVQSCSARQAAVGRGKTGVVTSSSAGGLMGSVSINNTLTCDHQPHAITAAFLQCSVDQPTFSALFPGRIDITGIKVANVPNFDSTGMSAWDARANSSTFSVFLDGAEQFYCQATDCSSKNSTTSVQSSAPWGTDVWSCSGGLQCFCPSTAKMCNNPAFPLASIINGLSGTIEFPCDYVDPSNPDAVTQCALHNPLLDSFVGEGGLALKDCSFSQCLAQNDVEQYWQQSTLAARGANGDSLSGGVIAGLVILGVALAALLATLGLGYWLRTKAARKPRLDDKQAIGLAWSDVHFHATAQATPRWLKKAGGGQEPGSVAPDEERVSGHEMRSQQQQQQQQQYTSEVMPYNEIPARGNSSAAGSTTHEKLQDAPTAVQADHSDRHILRGLSSCALPGSLNFIIGPSGAGKSSLVDVLAGRPKRGRVQGSLSLLSDHALPSAGAQQQRQIAVVDQDDSVCLPGYMTVREMLSFAAELSLAENVSKAERTKIVSDTLQQLGLRDIADHRIGDARTRGISGGERRRVSLGVALVGRPKILIADECTSGLDAFSAHRIVTALRSLACGAQGGTTIIATLHQPSSQIFEMADRATLLSEGRVLFDGPPSAAMGFCRSAGVPVPAGHNVADHLLTYAFERMLHPHSAQRNIATGSVVNSAGNGEREKASTAQKGEHADAEVAPSNEAVRNAEDARAIEAAKLHPTPLRLHHAGSAPVTTFITQLHALAARSMLMTRREMLGAVSHIGGSAVVAVFTGACFFQVGLNLGGFQNRVGSMFFVFILLLFSSLSALVGLHKTRLLMMRERANGLYAPGSWLASHLLYDLVLLRAIPAILIVCIVYWMVGLNPKASNFFLFMLITVIFAWVTALYNMVLAALIEEIGTGILLAALYILANLFLAGFIMSLDSMPSAVRWLRWIFPAKYALEAVASNELKGLQFVDTFAGVPVSTSVSLFANKLFGFEDGAYYRNLIVLSCGFLVGFSLTLFGAVHWRMREIR